MRKEMLADIACYSSEGARLREEFFSNYSALLCDAAEKIVDSLCAGGKILICGNGGSAADAQHIAAEFVNKFLVDRPAIASIALTTDSSAITAIGNDRGFDQIFSRQVAALGRQGDILLAISTSGSSSNILAALLAARDVGIFTIGFTGNGKEGMGEKCDILFNVPSTVTPLIQEIHITIGHLLCKLVDKIILSKLSS